MVEDSTRIASRHATRGMKIDQRTRCEDRDDASISKVVEWFRALALLPPLPLCHYLSLFPLFFATVSLSLSLSSFPSYSPSRDRIAVCRGICPWQFGFELFAIFFISFPVISRASGSRRIARASDVSDRVSISRLWRDRGYLPLLNRPLREHERELRRERADVDLTD